VVKIWFESFEIEQNDAKIFQKLIIKEAKLRPFFTQSGEPQIEEKYFSIFIFNI
jgi:hypothetical protein